ncbi:MAG: aldo/keto reductase [Angelakisella sp.]
MATVTLGSTGITVNKNGFGALPIQRISVEDAGVLLRKAYDHGIRFFDTSRMYTDSEHKICQALRDVRSDIIIATKTPGKTVEEFWRDLDTSLTTLGTDYIDIYQFHNLPFCPKPGDGTGLYEAMLEAKASGKIRHIGITNHRIHVAVEAVESGLYETLQYPFSYLTGEKELALVESCRKHNVGFICMKALAGGLIKNSAAAYAFLADYDNVLPIWGVQRESELDEFISYIDNPPSLTPALAAVIAEDRSQLTGNFCRSCGYCLPCPANIDIPQAARMSLLLRRSPVAGQFSPEVQQRMANIDNCTGCNHCAKHCPYGLDTPKLLRENYTDYLEMLEQYRAEHTECL